MSFYRCMTDVCDKVKSYMAQTLNMMNETKGHKDAALLYRNQSVDGANRSETARDEAVSAANTAVGVVIPSNAAYSYIEIDDMYEVLLSRIIETEVRASINAGALNED